MFLIGMILYIVPAVIFIFFGSGEVQPWNDEEQQQAASNKDVEQPKSASVAPELPEKEKTIITRL